MSTRREGARGGGDRGGAAGGKWARERVRAARKAQARLALLHRPALRQLRHPLFRSHARPLLVQLADRRMRHVPRLRARDRRRLRPGDPGRVEDPRDGAIKTFQSKSYDECQDDLEKLAPKRGIPLDTPWRELTAAQKQLGDRRRHGLGELAASPARRTGTACSASSTGWRPRRTRCTSACCSRGIAPTRRAPRAAGRGSSPSRCSGAWARRKTPTPCSSRPRATSRRTPRGRASSWPPSPASRSTT